MDYIDLVQKTLDYIDNNIEKKITPKELSELVGFSTYYFYRIFNNIINIPVSDYITKRKLQYALYELSMGKKVVDIAFIFGFETHSGFTKAFKKNFGYAPNLYRMHAPATKPKKVNLKELNKNKTGGIIMQPKIIEKQAFKIVGYKFETTLKDNAHTRDIPVFWNECGFDGENYEEKLYKTQNPKKHGEYGLCVPKNPDCDEFYYIFGVEVDNFIRVLPEMYKLEVPSATYAVFTTPCVEDDDFVKSIQGTWKYILEEWFPTSGYEIDESKLDFELYDERCHPWQYEKVSMDIYIPIKKRT